MSVLDAAKKRYSVRKYKETPVESEKLKEILKAAQAAPTAANKQPHRLVVITSDESMEKVKKATPFTFGAPMIILVLGDHSDVWVRPYDKKDMVDIDTSIVTTHMMLTAADLGLGTCWVTYFDPEIIKKEFNLHHHMEPVSILTVGYSDDKVQSPDRHSQTRKDFSEFVFYESI